MAKTFEETLVSAKKTGASRCSDAELLALFCNTSLQILCGAVSPKLVFEGAQKKGLSAKEVLQMAKDNPQAVADLMWL